MMEQASTKQKQSIAWSNRRINIWEGAIRSGKTIASIVRWMVYTQLAPPGHLLMVGKTERTLKRNILDPMAELALPGNFKLVSGSGVAYLYGRPILLAGANDERAEGKIRGLTVAGVYGDELTLWPENMFTQLLGRMSVPGAMLFGTTNPDSPAHWLKKKYLDRARELNLIRFHFELADNPGLSAEYIRDISKEYTGLWYDRNIKGKWVVAEGAVYPMFDRSKMVIDHEPLLRHWWIAIDHGARNATVFLRLGIDGDGRLVVTHEYYHSGRISVPKSPAAYSRDFMSWHRGFSGYPEFAFIDPAAKGFSDQLFDDGFTTWPAENDVRPGLEFLSSLMTNDLFRVHRRCEHLIEGIESYIWDEKASLRGEDKPVKSDDDAADCLRYGAYSMRHLWPRFNRFDLPEHLREAA